MPLLTAAQEVRFTDQTLAAGIDVRHRIDDRQPAAVVQVSGGVAVADINLDGFPDLYALTGQAGTGKLLVNRGDGTFQDLTRSSGLSGMQHLGAGPLFFHFDGDAYPDLIVGSADGTPPQLFRNRGDGTFSKVSVWALAALSGSNTSSITAADIDRDGDQDLFLSHWQEPFLPGHFLKNEGGRDFELADRELGFTNGCGGVDYGFAANFRDLDGDGYPELLLAADFGCTQLWWNRGGRKFELDEHSAFTDENGMGSAVGDFDNDGDEDWFVTSIFDDDGTLEGDWSGSGNRLYENLGQGNFVARSAATTPLDAGWGWAAAAADLNHDGWLDLTVVNGWPRGSAQFRNQPTRLFWGTGGGSFSEGVALPDSLQGRGLSCLDYDGDGDLDLLIANYDGPLRLLRNDHPRPGESVSIRPVIGGRTDAGATVTLYTNLGRQRRTIAFGSNYASQDPAVAHFGLGAGVTVDSLVVLFSDDRRVTFYELASGGVLDVVAPEGPGSASPPGIGVFPNPIGPDTRIYVPQTAETVPPALWSADGKLNRELQFCYRADGFDVYLIPASANLSRGIYWITFPTAGGRKSLRSPALMKN